MNRTMPKLAAGFLGAVAAAGTASAAWAGSAVVSPSPAPAGSTITINVTCDSSTDTVFFAGNSIFSGTSNLNGAGQGALQFTLRSDLTDGSYKVGPFQCASPSPHEKLYVNVVVGPLAPSPSAAPSGAPKTGGGAMGTPSRGWAAGSLGLAGLLTAGLLFARRRRSV